MALNYRLHEFDEQVKAVRDGMSKVIPVPLLSLFSASQLQVRGKVNRFISSCRPFNHHSVSIRFLGNGMWIAGNPTGSAEIGCIVQGRRRNIITCPMVLGSNGRIFES